VGGLTPTLAAEVQPSGGTQAPLQPVLPLAGLFRFGRLTASVHTNDASFARRFQRIFHDCRETGSPGTPASVLHVRVGCAGEPVEAWIAGHRELAIDVSERLLPGVAIECHGERLRVAAEAAWPIFLAHYFVHHVMALQRDVLFLHGAAIDVRGRGLLLVGEKGAGKSTLALALGSRGHPVLGDEVAAILASDGTCLPFRRAVSIRDGPQAAPIRAALEKETPEVERLPDGTIRRRMALSQLFPGAAPGPVVLEAAVFLRGFGERREVERFEFSARHVGWVGPLLATFSNRAAGLAALDLMRLFSRLRCYRVTIAGEPGTMAECLEPIAEDR
jgi:hypothetical protein